MAYDLEQTVRTLTLSGDMPAPPLVVEEEDIEEDE